MNLKKKVARLLAENDREGLMSLLEEDRRVISRLNRLIFDDDTLIRWRAVRALGWIAAEDPYLLEKIIGRLIYTLNDDSGSIGWMAPQALGEICANDPDLVEDFFPIVISSAHLDVFRPGAIWAVGRVAPIRPDLVEDTGPMLEGCLKDPSAEVRGLACWALANLDYRPSAEAIRYLVKDPSALTFFEDGVLMERTVGEMAESALSWLNAD